MEEYEGIRPMRGSIQLDFRLSNGTRKRPTLPLSFTSTNCKQAARLLAKIKKEIALGTFDWNEYFPDSKLAALTGDTLEEVASRWLARCKTIGNPSARRDQRPLKYASMLKYRRITENVWCESLGSKRIGEITCTDIDETLIAHASEVGPKQWNHFLLVVRGIFSQAEHEGMEGVGKVLTTYGNRKWTPPDPDPLDDVAHWIEWNRQHQPEQVANALEFLVTTGMRPGEMIALRWSHVDLKTARAHILLGKNLWVESDPKDGPRRIDLLPQAMAVLQRQRKFTYLKNDHIFHHPILMTSYADIRALSETYWPRYFKDQGVRYRPLYSARATFASVQLSAGMPSKWVADQLGHGSSALTEKHYAKWVQTAMTADLRARAAGAFGQQPVSSTPEQAVNS